MKVINRRVNTNKTLKFKGRLHELYNLLKINSDEYIALSQKKKEILLEDDKISNNDIIILEPVISGG